MIICETEFERSDPSNPDYSMTEIDFYSHIPYGSNFPQHRLTLRKNLKTGFYEAIRVYQRRYLISRKGLTIDTGRETGQVEVAYRSESLKEILDWLNIEVQRFWGQVHSNRELDKPCEHKPPNLYWRCPIWKKMPLHEKIKFYRGLVEQQGKQKLE